MRDRIKIKMIKGFFIQGLEKFIKVCNNKNIEFERGVLMAGNLATKQKHKVGWGFYLNNKNTVASQNSSGSENLTDPKMVLTPLSTPATASYKAETLVLSGFQGGGGGNP